VVASVLFDWLMRTMPTTMAGLLAFWGDTLEDIVVERFGRLFIHLCFFFFCFFCFYK
jgi:hypothetical protein